MPTRPKTDPAPVIAIVDWASRSMQQRCIYVGGRLAYLPKVGKRCAPMLNAHPHIFTRP